MRSKIELTILLFIISFTLSAQDKYSKINLDDIHDYSEFESFFPDSVMAEYAVFFTGENHTYAKVNSQTEFKLLIYLHEKFGVNHFLFEQGPALGYIINRITVDGNLLNRFYLKDRFYEPFFELITNIRKYNEKSPDSLKILTHGIDLERFPAFSIHVLNELVDSLPTQGETGRIYESIKALATSEFLDGSPDDIYNSGGTRFNLNGDVIDAWSTFNTIIYDSRRLKDSLAVELGEHYDIFMEIIESVEKGHQWYHEENKGDLTGPITRERFMLAQFERISKRYQSAKFYGQFGRCHLHSNKKAKRCYSYDMTSIARRIGEMNDSIYKDRVLTIPIIYKTYNNFDREAIRLLRLDSRFNGKNQSFIIDLDYLDGDSPLIGFSNSLKYAIINSYPPDGYEMEYNFDYHLEELHFGAYVGTRYVRKLASLNTALIDAGANPFQTDHRFYTFAFDYFDIRNSGFHLSYTHIPEMYNGDRFWLKGGFFTFGNSYPVGNKWALASFGLNYSFGSYSLKEETFNPNPNLIQEDNKNIVVYTNDLVYLDPNIDLRLTLPFISLNAKAGYAWDISGKFWKLESKVKSSDKTNFSSAYFMLGASINFKDKY